MPTRKLVVRSARLNCLDDQKFRAVHTLYKHEYDEKMKDAGYDSFHCWTFADTLTRIVRDKFDCLDAGNNPLNAAIFQEGDAK